MKKKFLTKQWTATGVGSLPFISGREACAFISDVFRNDIIFWPQLVKRSFFEDMYVQYSEGIPGFTVDVEARKVYVDTTTNFYQRQLEAALEHYVSGDVDYFAIGGDHAAGFHEMLATQDFLRLAFFKGQVTGPVSLGLGLRQENDRAIIYNRELYQVLVKVLGMKARWQVRQFKKKNPNLNVIIFIDEPYLVSIGSSFVSVSKEDVTRDLNEIIDAIHQEGGHAGVHCCGNTDWSVLLKTEIDILNFDAFGFLDNLLLFESDVRVFLKNGGVLAWGIVPTSSIDDEAALEQDLLARLNRVLSQKRLGESASLLTSSCGCGTLSDEQAKKIHRVTARLVERLNSGAV